MCKEMCAEDKHMSWPLVEEAHFPHCSGKRKGILSHGRKLRESLLRAEVFSRAE